MNTNDIQQKPAQLPDNLMAENARSGEDVLSKYQRFSETEYNEWILPVCDLVQKLARTENAKLFRAGASVYSLLIATVEKNRLENEEPFVTIFIGRNIKPSLIYSSHGIKVLKNH